ncbi:MAG: hypothetical protein AB7G12_04730 [Thermoanaerobaculia bacterium]
MNFHADVVRDLVPLVLAGEASAASRELVERALASDPELARLVARGTADGSLTSAPPPAPAPESAKRAFDATRRLLRLRGWLLGAGIFTSLLPFSVAGGESGIRFFLLRDAPFVALAAATLAVASWTAFAAVTRRLRVTGL